MTALHDTGTTRRHRPALSVERASVEMKGHAVVFNIGSQHGAINDVAGELAAALRTLGLGESARDADDIGRELTQRDPDRGHISTRLLQIARTVTAVAAAESAVHRPLIALAEWLGAPGFPVLRVLGL